MSQSTMSYTKTRKTILSRYDIKNTIRCSTGFLCRRNLSTNELFLGEVRKGYIRIQYNYKKNTMKHKYKSMCVRIYSTSTQMRSFVRLFELHSWQLIVSQYSMNAIALSAIRTHRRYHLFLTLNSINPYLWTLE